MRPPSDQTYCCQHLCTILFCFRNLDFCICIVIMNVYQKHFIFMMKYKCTCAMNENREMKRAEL